MRVALLTPAFWPEVRRGTERTARELADGLLALGHEVSLVTAHDGRPSAAVEDGLHVVRVRRPRAGRFLAARGWEEHLLHVPLVRRALAADPPDVVHALYPSDALAAPPGVPVVLSLMGLAGRRWAVAAHPRPLVVQRALRRASAVTVLSRAAHEVVLRDLGVDARTIAPPVDLTAFRPGPGRAPVPTVLCAADHTVARKGVRDLLRAWPAIRAEHPDARLVLSRVAGAEPPAGPGVEARDLDDREALAAANREAWAAVLPSYGEAFGLVAAEALACGTPCVVRDDGALPEVVDSDAIGRRFTGDGLARALLEALALRDPDACRRRAEAFSRDACAAAFDGLYREVLRAG